MLISKYINLFICYSTYCHMVGNMLSYGKGRSIHDGRRTQATAERAWMELVQEDTARKSVSVCTEVEKGRGIHRCTVTVVGYYARANLEEDSNGAVDHQKIKAGSFTGYQKNVVARLTLNYLQQERDNHRECYLVLMIHHFAAKNQVVKQTCKGGTRKRRAI